MKRYIIRNHRGMDVEQGGCGGAAAPDASHEALFAARAWVGRLREHACVRGCALTISQRQNASYKCKHKLLSILQQQPKSNRC